MAEVVKRVSPIVLTMLGMMGATIDSAGPSSQQKEKTLDDLDRLEKAEAKRQRKAAKRKQQTGGTAG